MKAALISDIHAADRPPSSCTGTYLEDLLVLLNLAHRQAVRAGCQAIIWAGDIFHLKAPGRTSHRLVQVLVDLVQAETLPVLIVPGNHDMQHDRLASVEVTQPLGVLLKAGAVLLDGWADEMPVYGVPWLQGYGAYTEASDIAVGKAFEQYRKQLYELGTGTAKALVVAHAPLYPPGRELKYEYFPAERWWEAMGSSRGGSHYVFYGHVHEPHGTWGFYDEKGGITFCNNGALSRGSLHEYNLTRQVGVTIWDSETGEFEFIPLPARPASEVFRLTEKQQATDLQGRLDEFLASVSATSLEVMTAESVLAHVRSLGLGKDAVDLIEELITEAQHAR